MSWPFIPHECPSCRYCDPLEEPFVEDTEFRYEIVAVCLHPRIATELFRRQLAVEGDDAHCPFFVTRDA